MPQIVTAATVDDAAARHQTVLTVASDAVITASAADRARQRGITIEKAPASRAPTAPRRASAPLAAWRRPAAPPPRYEGPRPLPQLADFERLRAALDRHRLDAIVCALPHNVYYLSGFDCEPLWEMVPYAHVIFPRHAEPALITSGLQLARAVEYDLWVQDIWPTIGGDVIVFDTTAMLETEARIKELRDALRPRASATHSEAILKVLADRRLLQGRLGFDDMRVALRLEQPIDAVDAVDVMREVRMIKSPAEIDLMRAAAQANEESALEAVRAIPRLRTWDDVVDTFKAAMARRHAEARYLVGGVHHHMATFQTIKDYTLRRGDFFMIDALGAKAHYYGDLGRAGSWGEPDRLVRERYDALRKGLEAGLEAARPGRLVTEVNEIVRETIRRAGNTNQRLSALHSVGLEHTDMPRRPDMRVQTNMTMNFDIGYMEAGFGAVHLEDTFWVKESGYELLTSGKNQLIVL